MCFVCFRLVAGVGVLVLLVYIVCLEWVNWSCEVVVFLCVPCAWVCASVRVLCLVRGWRVLYVCVWTVVV